MSCSRVWILRQTLMRTGTTCRQSTNKQRFVTSLTAGTDTQWQQKESQAVPDPETLLSLESSASSEAYSSGAAGSCRRARRWAEGDLDRNASREGNVRIRENLSRRERVH